MIEKTRSVLCQKLGHVPNDKEVANFLEMDEKMVNEAIMAGKDIMSLDEKDLMPVYEMIASEEKTNVDDQIMISDSLERLTPDEQKIIKARFYEDMTQSEVARKLAMTQVMVSRYEKRSINKMREYLKM